MSETQNTIASLFEMQRRALEQGQQTLEQNMAIQRQMTDAVLDTMNSQKETQKKGVGVLRSTTDAYLDAFDAALPGETRGVEDMHTAVEDQFAALDEVHSQMWEAFERNVRENADAYESLSDRYLSAMNESVDLMLEANRQWEEQSVTATEAVEETVE